MAPRLRAIALTLALTGLLAGTARSAPDDEAPPGAEAPDDDPAAEGEASDAETEARDRRLRRLLGIAANEHETERGEAALEALLEADRPALRTILRETLDEADDGWARAYAAWVLARAGASDDVEPLARAAVTDPFRPTRVHAVRALQSLDAPAAAEHIHPALESRDPRARLHAAQGLAHLPAPHSVPRLIRGLRIETGRWGQVHASFLTRRSYIADYELSSGGSGFSVAELADPEIGQMGTGTTVTTQVRRVVIIAMGQALARLTGTTEPGLDPDAWAAWWEAHADDPDLPVNQEEG